MKNFEKAFASTLEIACKEEYFDTIETPAKKGWDEAKWEPTMIEPIDYIGQEKERISLLLPEARKGNVRAMSELGFLFLEYTNDVRAAVYWLSKAAKHDDAEALWHLASCYSDRRHKQCDARASLKLLKRAARQGHVPSMRRLGLYYEQAFSVPYDAKKAAGYYAQAAKQGDFESLYRLGRLYYMGRDIERDYAKAFELFSQAAAHPYAADSQIRDELLFHDEGTQVQTRLARSSRVCALLLGPMLLPRPRHQARRKTSGRMVPKSQRKRQSPRPNHAEKVPRREHCHEIKKQYAAERRLKAGVETILTPNLFFLLE